MLQIQQQQQQQQQQVQKKKAIVFKEEDMANAYKAHDKYGGVYTVPTTTILPWYKPKRYEKPPKPESAEAATLPSLCLES